MIECFVNRNTKELLVSLEFESDVKCKGACWNNEYDAIKFTDEVELQNLITEKDGKKYLNFEHTEDKSE